VTNTEHYFLIAGRTQAWDTELLARTEAGESLTSVQEDFHRRGFRSVTLHPQDEGWVPRSTHPSLWEIPPTVLTTDTALLWADIWVGRFPSDLEVIIRKADLSPLFEGI